MDELSEDQIRELEEQLYSQVHHQSSTFSDINNVDTKQTEETQTENTKFLSNRYWAKGSEPDKVPQKQKEKFAKNEANKSIKNGQSEEQQHIHTKKGAAPEKGKQKMNKVRNPFASSKQNPKHVQLNTANFGGPFSRQAQQLQRVVQYENKKQRAKNARAAKAKRPKVVEVVVLSSSESESDEVVVVPMPPVPVYDIDDSDEDGVTRKSEKEERGNTTEAFITPKTKDPSPSCVVNEQASDIASHCNSPTSVMSHDDFIVQNDRQRLLGSGTMIDDNDAFLEPPTPLENMRTDQDSPNEIECIGTFIKPTATVSPGNKQSYRVDRSGFGAMDVYESESDILSDGVYSKGMPKPQTPSTTIRNIANSSGSEVEATTPVQLKTKRLRKRRASESIKGSESNGGAESSDSNDDDGVAATGVPFIARGPAVEGCKSKRFRRRAVSTCAPQEKPAHGDRTGHMSDSEFIATLNSLAQGCNNDEETRKDTEGDESDAENLPTARDIAETVINQQQANTSTPVRRTVQVVVEEPSPNITPNTLDISNNYDEAVPPQIADDIEKLFDKINELNAKKAIEISDEEDLEQSALSHIDPSSDVSTAVVRQNISDEQLEPMNSEIKYFIAHIPANIDCISDGFGWNEEMRRFYNCSWGGETMREDDILRHMNRDKRLWTISDADRNMIKKKRSKEKCVNCHEFGHLRYRCPKPKKPLVCYMCGESGHLEPRCPNTRCLRCGSKTTIFSQCCKKCLYWSNRICPICKLRGHSLNDCPDKWRRYHSTIKPNVFPNSTVIYNKRRYCCYCGKRGHLSDECNKALYRSEYPMASTEIKSHEKSYDDVLTRSYREYEIPCRLLYDPTLNVKFDLAANTTHKLVYGRFLCAVGLGNLIAVKNVQPKTKPIQSSLKALTYNVDDTQPSCSHAVIRSPDQVQEISESISETSVKETESLQMPPPRIPDQQAHDARNESAPYGDREGPSTFTGRKEAKNHHHTNSPPGATTTTTNEPIDHDSDSNYSFSDHFEPPTSSKSAPLPDFISLSGSVKRKFDDISDDGTDEQEEELHRNGSPKLGISAKYVDWASEKEGIPLSPIPYTDEIPADKPCEAKIYISNEHSHYFQSKAGREYLTQIMQENNLRGRLNKTVVGYAIFIYGLPENQEKLQHALELKFKSLIESRLVNHDAACMVPKTVDTLIRYIRECINQLYNHLGNASEIYDRMVELENNNSKKSTKSADRMRRLLNMIFLGQTFLCGGDEVIQTLVNGLRTLLDDFDGADKAPEDLRNTIDVCYRKIFTAYNHDNYSELLSEYLSIPSALRHRLQQLKIDPFLMGRAQFSISVNDEQKTRSNEHSKQCDNAVSNMKAVEEGTLLLNVVKTDKIQKSVNKQSTSIDNVKSQKNQRTPEKTQPKQHNLSSDVEKEAEHSDGMDDNECRELLSEIADSATPHIYVEALKDSRNPSMFWSRESLRYLQELINLASDKRPTLERLQRINKKAMAGRLSYNDYRTVVELHNVTARINKK